MDAMMLNKGITCPVKKSAPYVYREMHKINLNMSIKCPALRQGLNTSNSLVIHDTEYTPGTYQWVSFTEPGRHIERTTLFNNNGYSCKKHGDW